MFDAGLTVENLRACLAGVEPVRLKGMALLRECRPAGHFFPTGLPREVITEAVQEIIAYTARCHPAHHFLDSGIRPMTILHETYHLLAKALAGDPLLCLANCVVWLDPLWTRGEDENGYDEGDGLETALSITRDVFPDLYAGAVERLRSGASDLDLEGYLCDHIRARGIPLDHVECMAWGIPLTACGADLTDPEFLVAHADLLPILEVFGVIPDSQHQYVEIPAAVYTAGEVIAASLERHADPRWRQVGWVMQWLFSYSGNTLVDYTDEALADIEALRWEAEDIAFAVALIQEAEGIMQEVNTGLRLVKENPAVLPALAQNVERIQRAIELQQERPDQPKVRLKWPNLVPIIDERKIE